MAEVLFTDAAIDDLRRLGPDVVPKVLKKIQLLFGNLRPGIRWAANSPDFASWWWDAITGGSFTGSPLTGPSRSVKSGAWALRSDAEVYAEALERVGSSAEEGSTLARLADVIARLGRLAGDVVVEPVVPREPVPDWLAHRLVHTAGVPLEQVAALTLEQAVDLWTDFMTVPRPSEPIGTRRYRK